MANPGRFFAFVARAIQPNQFSRPLLRPKRLILSVGIKRDDLVRRIQNVSRRAVVLLQLDNSCIRKILFKIENVANVRAAPAVNGLVVIADNAQISALRSQQTHKHILRIVRILILIDMDIADFALIGFQHRRMLGKKFQRLNDQIVKVQRIGAFQLFFISVVNIINQLAAIIPFALGEPILRAEQFVFCVGNLAFNFSGRQELVVDIQLFEDFLQRAHLVVIIVNGERTRVAQLFNIQTQNFGTTGVKRRNPNFPCTLACQFFNALTHLFGGFVGKGDGHNRPRRYTVFQQVRYAIRQCARLTRSRARKHQKRPFKRFRREPLFSVQIIQIHGLSSLVSSPNLVLPRIS